MKLSRAQLLPGLRELFPDPAGSPLDVSAIMFSLSLWESGGNLGAVGDNGASFGLWQVHQPTWAGTIGSFDMESATDAELARALSYQSRYVKPVLKDMLGTVTRGVAEVAARAKRGEKLRFSPIKDLPVWASLAWQYGSPSLTKFVKTSKDLSAEGWRSYRTANRLPIQTDHDKRQGFIRNTYFRSLRSPAKLLTRLQAISRATGVDFFTNAAKALKVNEREINAWARANGASLLKLKGGTGIIPMVIGAGMLYYAATEEGKKGGRQFTQETKTEVGGILSGLAILLMGRLQK